MPEINEALLGTLPGQTQRFRKNFPDDFPNEEFRGKTVDYELTLVALKEKRLPEVNDEFAKTVAENETAAGLREKVREGLRREKEGERRRKFRRAIVDTLLARMNLPAPETLVESETVAALKDYARYLAANGMDPKQVDWEKMRQDARPGAERRVKEYLLLDDIARRETIEVSDTEVEAEFKRAAARRGVDPAALREQMAKNDGLEALRDEIRLSRAVDVLISSAKVLPSGVPVEVNESRVSVSVIRDRRRTIAFNRNRRLTGDEHGSTNTKREAAWSWFRWSSSRRVAESGRTTSTPASSRTTSSSWDSRSTTRSRI